MQANIFRYKHKLARAFRYKHKLARAIFCFALLLGLSAALLPRAYAQTATDRKFSRETGAIVNTTVGRMNSDDFATSLDSLDKLLRTHDLTSYETSIILQLKGQAHYELEQFSEAIRAFEGAIAAGGLLDNEVNQLRLNIGQILVVEGGDDALRGYDMIAEWHSSRRSQHIITIAQVDCFSSCNDESALLSAERWFNEANPKERKHYDLLNYIYSYRGLEAKRSILLDEMKERWPEDFED